jgi:hypothetical protein
VTGRIAWPEHRAERRGKNDVADGQAGRHDDEIRVDHDEGGEEDEQVDERAAPAGEPEETGIEEYCPAQKHRIADRHRHQVGEDAAQGDNEHRHELQGEIGHPESDALEAAAVADPEKDHDDETDEIAHHIAGDDSAHVEKVHARPPAESRRDVKTEMFFM